MKIANATEFAERATYSNTRDINPARLVAGDDVIGFGKVKTVGEGCTPETVHINDMHCYDTRVDVSIKR